MNTTKPLEQLADIAIAARELRRLPRQDVILALRFIRMANPEVYVWLRELLGEL
jgi:hypothetical protein